MLDAATITEPILKVAIIGIQFVKNLITLLSPAAFVEWIYIGVSVLLAYLLSKAKFILSMGPAFMVFMSIIIFIILKLA